MKINCLSYFVVSIYYDWVVQGAGDSTGWSA